MAQLWNKIQYKSDKNDIKVHCFYFEGWTTTSSFTLKEDKQIIITLLPPVGNWSTVYTRSTHQHYN